MSDRILGNRYVLESEIGRGGMGVVYKATDTQVQRTVAVKTLPAVISHNQDLMCRFHSEVQHASKLEHPNIVRVYDVGEDDGTHYYVMQYIEGADLRSKLKKRGRYSVDETIAIVSQIADALDYAHSQGIVHRDIKPENILLDEEGNAHIVDFGIAKAAEGTRTTRGMLGTPEYMSPEQVKGKSVDGRSDQYSLAVVAYEMLTGRTPFKTEGDDPWAQINMHLNTPVPNPRDTLPDIPAHVANALLQALAKKPEKRCGSCAEFVKALRGEIKVTAPTSRKLQHRIVMGAGLSVLGAVLVVAMLSSRNVRHTGAPTAPESTLQLLYVTSSSSVGSVNLVSEDGSSVRHLTWVDGDAEFYSADGQRFAGNKLLPTLELDKIWVTGEDGKAVCEYTPEKFRASFGMELDCVTGMSPDGRHVLVWCVKELDPAPFGRKDLYALCTLNPDANTMCVIDAFQIERPDAGMNFAPRIMASIANPVFSASSRQIAYARPTGEVFLYDMRDRHSKMIARAKRDDADGGTITSMVFDSSERSLAIGTSKGALIVVDMRKMTQKEYGMQSQPGKGILVLALTPTQAVLFNGQDICRFDFSQSRVVEIWSQPSMSRDQWPWEFRASADGWHIAASAGGQLLVYYVDEERWTKIATGRALGWIRTETASNKPVAATNGSHSGVVGLKMNEKVTKSYSADFDGDGRPETVYDSGSRLWLVDNGAALWSADHYGPKVLIQDVTHDGVADILMFAHTTEYKNYCVNVYGWVAGSMKLLLSKTFFCSGVVLIGPSTGKGQILILDDPSRTDETIVYKWDGGRFISGEQKREHDLDWYLDKGYTALESDPNCLPR